MIKCNCVAIEDADFGLDVSFWFPEDCQFTLNIPLEDANKFKVGYSYELSLEEIGISDLKKAREEMVAEDS